MRGLRATLQLMDFAQFISPVPVDQFLSEHFNRKPLHIQGGSSRAGLLSLARLEELLGILPHWTEQNLKLIINSRPVVGHHYLDQQASGGRRADPAKVEVFMRMGASLVADHVEDVDMHVREVVALLGREFGGTAGANAYCSFKDVQAFNSHCDAHDVFAVQIEGEKVWRIYENRANSPVEPLEGADAQAIIDQAKGPVAMTVRMQPGDLLYIPRGYFHDALAQSDVSLHLTFAVLPLDGRSIFKMLEEQAKLRSGFRAYLPDGRSNPEGLRSHLAKLAGEVAEMIRSPLFESKLVARQRALATNAHRAEAADSREAGLSRNHGEALSTGSSAGRSGPRPRTGGDAAGRPCRARRMGPRPVHVRRAAAEGAVSLALGRRSWCLDPYADQRGSYRPVQPGFVRDVS